MSETIAEGNGYPVAADPDIRRFIGDFGPRELVALTKAADVRSRRALGGSGNLMEELGRSGLRHWGGFVFEEWLRELQQGRRAAEVYREMADSDPVIGAILYAIEMLLRRVTWWVEPKKSKEAEWFESVLHDMHYSWADTISEVISFLTYGYSYHETVWKLRKGESRDPNKNSKFTDGTIGLAKIPLRAQDALWKWVFDDIGEIEGMIQNPPPDYLLRFIPIEKALLFRTRIFKGNPEGRSILRNSYRSWYFVRNLQNVEGIGVERDLAGLPVLQPPEGVDIWDANDPAMASVRSLAQTLVSSIRRDEQEGVLVPFGWTLSLLSTGGTRQFDTSSIITRYEQRIATSVLADLVLMGQDKVGSYALAATKRDLFGAALESFLDIISSVINTQLIPRLWKLNGFTMPLPELKHGSVETIDLDTLGNFIMRVAGSGGPFEWKTTMPYLLDQAGMPQPTPEFDYEAEAAMASIRGPTPASTMAQATRSQPAQPTRVRNLGRIG